VIADLNRQLLLVVYFLWQLVNMLGLNLIVKYFIKCAIFMIHHQKMGYPLTLDLESTGSLLNFIIGRIVHFA